MQNFSKQEDVDIDFDFDFDFDIALDLDLVTLISSSFYLLIFSSPSLPHNLLITSHLKIKSKKTDRAYTKKVYFCILLKKYCNEK